MTEKEKQFISIIEQAKANVECENVTISQECLFRVFEKYTEKEQTEQLGFEHSLVKRKEFIYDKR